MDIFCGGSRHGPWPRPGGMLARNRPQRAPSTVSVRRRLSRRCPCSSHAELLDEQRPRPAHAALDGTGLGTQQAAPPRSAALRPDQEQGLPLPIGQAADRFPDYPEGAGVLLVGLGFEPAGLRALASSTLALRFPRIRVELVAQDREEPGGKVRAGRKVLPLRQALAKVSCTSRRPGSRPPASDSAKVRSAGNARIRSSRNSCRDGPPCRAKAASKSRDQVCERDGQWFRARCGRNSRGAGSPDNLTVAQKYFSPRARPLGSSSPCNSSLMLKRTAIDQAVPFVTLPISIAIET